MSFYTYVLLFRFSSGGTSKQPKSKAPPKGCGAKGSKKNTANKG